MRNIGPLPTIELVAPDGTIKTRRYALNTGNAVLDVVPDGKGGYRALVKSEARLQGWISLEDAYKEDKRKQIRDQGFAVRQAWNEANKNGTIGRVSVKQQDGDKTIEFTTRQPFPEEWLPQLVLERKGKKEPESVGWEAPKLKGTSNATA